MESHNDILKYPIGKFSAPQQITAKDREAYIKDLQELPEQLRGTVTGLTESQLDTPYRPEGWTIRQVIHHLPDSHLNSYVRFKWTLTEDEPLIKAYDERLWSTLPDSERGPINMSIDLLQAIHIRWVWLLNSLNEDQWKKRFKHPEMGKQIPLDVNLSLYSWHGKHHLAHINSLLERNNWK